MVYTQNKLQKSTLIATVCSILFIASCSDEFAVQQSTIHQNSSSITKPSLESANALYCPSGSENVQLDLTNTKLIREQDIPLMYQGTNNIEGPVWHDGALYYSNMGSHQSDKNGFTLTNQTTIWRWVQGEKPQVWMQDNIAGTNGLALNSEGKLLATRQLDGSISTIDWQTQQVTPIVSRFNNKRFNSPNDLTVAYDDTVYFTDPNWNTPSNISQSKIQGGGQPGSTEPGQRIYRVSADGKVNATAVTQLVPALRDKPNGIILSLNQEQLIVGGLQGLWVFDLIAGKVSNPKQLLNTPIDGLGKDCSGNIYITTTRETSKRKDDQVIVILNNKYSEVGTLAVPGIHIVTNIAFGGIDRKTLFVTGLTDPIDNDKPRMCGDKACLKAGIYTTKLNVQGFPF